MTTTASSIASKPAALGFIAATALVTGNMIGSGVFVMPASLADAAGPLAIVAMIVVALAFLALTSVFADLGNAFPIAGGPGAFVQLAFGPAAGLVAAFLYWLCVVIGNAAFLTAFVGYFAVLVPAAASPLGAFVTAQVFLWTLVAVNALGTKEAGVVQVITTVLKVAPLVVLAVALIPHARDGAAAGNLAPFAPKGLAAIFPAISLSSWLFLGSESATVAGDEVGDGRTIRRAAYTGFAVATVVYVAVTLVVVCALPSSTLSADAAPLAHAGKLAFGPAGELAITIAALISIVGVLNGWLVVVARAPIAAARAGMLPAVFGRTHPTRGTPYAGLLLAAVITSALVSLYFVQALLDAYNFIALFATATSLCAIGAACAALPVLARRHPDKFTPAARARAVVAGVFGVAVTALMIYGSGWKVIGLTVAAALLPLLPALLRRRSATA